jgi:hypothetical protein
MVRWMRKGFEKGVTPSVYRGRVFFVTDFIKIFRDEEVEDTIFLLVENTLLLTMM